MVIRPQIIANRFKINNPDKDLLGQGAMGNVYHGRDTQTGDAVAIKALKSEVVAGDPQLIERFIREGQALRQLNHPNIVKMLAAAEEDGRHYLVMEYVRGGSLRDLLAKQAQLPLTQVVEIALDLADALTRAHRLNIIHRDLKPANVMLATDGSVRLTDFGLAHFKSKVNLTTAGAVLGTPAYMSPEITMGQAAGEGSDIWSFGVILYEMLAGERPFQRNNPAALLMALLTDPVPDLTGRRSDVPEALLDLVYRMLDKNPGSRLPSVRLVGLELETLLKGNGLSLPAVSEWVPPVAKEPSISAFASPTPPASEPRYNLPVQTTPFVGRERELAQVASVLDEAGCQLVTLLGPGGVGKSRLSIEAAARQFEHFVDGVYFVPLAPLTSADSIAVTTAEAIHFSFVHPRDPAEQLLDHLRDKRVLLVMDNFEHVLPGAGLITAIIKAAPGVKVLVTSRVRLNLQAECLYEVGEMSFPNGTDDIAFEDFEAVQLFLAYARRTQPGYELPLKDQSAVARICQLVDGMPLGIELAAAWVRMLPLAEIATELERDLGLLETTMQDVPERQRSMRAAFDYSWNLLSAAEKDTFKKLSVFRGGFSRDAARHIAGTSLMALMGLVDKSLLRRTPAGRFEIHELTRQYGAEKLAAQPQQKQAVQDVHCDYYAAMLEQQEKFLSRGGRSDEDVQNDIKREMENIRTSWNWATIRGKAEALAKSVFALAIFHEYQGTHHAFSEWLRPALEKLESTAPENGNNVILGKLLIYQAQAFSRLGRVPEAIALFERALTLLDQPAGRPDRGVVLTLLALAHTMFGNDHEKAAHLTDEALAIHREFGNLWGIGVTVDVMALLLEIQGQPLQAKALLQENIPIFEKLDSELGLARVLVHLGGVANALAEYEEAKAYLADALAILKPAKDYIFMTLALNYLGDTAYALGAYPEADRYYRESFQIAFKRKLVPMALFGLAGLALLLPKKNVSQTEKAVEILTFTLNHPAAINVALFGKRSALMELENELSPEKFVAAQERSKVLDFETTVKELLA